MLSVFHLCVLLSLGFMVGSSSVLWVVLFLLCVVVGVLVEFLLWKGSFVALVYLGGLLVLMVYVASFMEKVGFSLVGFGVVFVGGFCVLLGVVSSGWQGGDFLSFVELLSGSVCCLLVLLMILVLFLVLVSCLLPSGKSLRLL